MNLLNVLLVWLTNFPLNLLLLFQWPQLVPVYIMLHIHSVLFHFFASLCLTCLSAGIATSISMHIFYFCFQLLHLAYLLELLFLLVPLDSITVSNLYVHILACVYVCVRVYTFSVVRIFSVLLIEWRTPSCLLMYYYYYYYYYYY
jgi:hypothetical protein